MKEEVPCALATFMQGSYDWDCENDGVTKRAFSARPRRVRKYFQKCVDARRRFR